MSSESPEVAPDALRPRRASTRGRRRTAVLGGVVTVLGSWWFAAAVLVAFAAQAAWVAVSARLVIYDEKYHLLAIEAFSHRRTPILDQELTDGAIGDAERYGSWVYHYLMSIPWRLMRGAGVEADTRIIVLRLVTVLMVVASLVIFRAIFRSLGASRAVANVTLLVLAGSPLVVFLSGAVSYDNMLFMVAAGFYLAVLRVWRSESLDVSGWLAVIALAGLGSVTKYTFLPVVAILGVVLLVRQAGTIRRELVPAARGYLVGLGRSALVRRVALILAALLGVVMVVERYVVNLVVYRALTPACEAVHDTDICAMFGPWARNVELRESFDALSPSLHTFLDYLGTQWVPLMFRYSTLIGVVDADDVTRSTTGPSITGVVTALFVVALGVVLVIGWGAVKQIVGARLLLAASAFYLLVLFVQNYTDYLSMGVAVGVASRYALLVYPLVLGVACIAVSKIVTQTSVSGGRGLKVLLVVGLLVCLLQGGGFLSYLVSVEPEWLQDPDGLAGRTTLRLADLARWVVLDDALVEDPRF